MALMGNCAEVDVQARPAIVCGWTESVLRVHLFAPLDMPTAGQKNRDVGTSEKSVVQPAILWSSTEGTYWQNLQGV